MEDSHEPLLNSPTNKGASVAAIFCSRNPPTSTGLSYEEPNNSANHNLSFSRKYIVQFLYIYISVCFHLPLSISYTSSTTFFGGSIGEGLEANQGAPPSTGVWCFWNLGGSPPGKIKTIRRSPCSTSAHRWAAQAAWVQMLLQGPVYSPPSLTLLTIWYFSLLTKSVKFIFFFLPSIIILCVTHIVPSDIWTSSFLFFWMPIENKLQMSSSHNLCIRVKIIIIFFM